jgi:mercuric ion transport protein
MIDSKANGATKCVKVGAWGSILAALCCFTPLLVVVLGVVGLGALSPYLDYFLLPALGLFLLLVIVGLWQKYRQTE